MRAALNKVARKREMRYEDLGKVAKGVRQHFHDDITVVVIFLEPNSKLSVGVSIFMMILLSAPL